MLGIPTYGHEYEITASPEQFNGYKKLWSLNPIYALDTAKEYKITPTRDRAGEISFSYFATSSPFRILNDLPVPSNTKTGEEASARALMFATQSNIKVKFNLVVWTDAEAVRQKVDLAQELGLRGVALFKIDNGEDKGIWDLF
jgi:spore germination protein YaaH